MASRRPSREPVHRVIRWAGLSRPEFMKRFGWSANRMTAQDQARLPGISTPLLDQLEKLCREKGTTLDSVADELFGQDIEEAYDDYRAERRAAYGVKLPLEMPARQEGESPIAWLIRAVGGYSRLANWLCMHDYVIQRYWQGEQGMPEELPTAIRDSGWKWAESFIQACQNWDAQTESKAA